MRIFFSMAFILFFLISCVEKTAKIEKKEAPSLVKEVADLGYDGVLNLPEFKKYIKENNHEAVELQATLIGEIDEMSPDKKDHILRYYLLGKEGAKTEVNVLNEDLSSYLGREVSFRGISKGNEKVGFVYGTSPLTGVVKDVVFSQIPIEKKMLILLVKFDDAQDTFITADEVQEDIFNGAFNRFFKDLSDGKMIHSGDVKGWYHLPRLAGQTDMICGVTNQEVKTIAGHYQIKLADYEVVTVVSNCATYGTIGGRTYVSAQDIFGIGKKQYLIRMASRPDILRGKASDDAIGVTALSSILIHERGHNFQLEHSSGLDCGTATLAMNCDHIEYGHPHDRMGYGYGGMWFNAFQLVRGGFRSAENIHEITRSGIYTIDKITSKKSNRKIGAYIYSPVTNKPVFMLEYRTPEGMDLRIGKGQFLGATTGLTIYTMQSTMGESGQHFGPRLIDPNPTEEEWFSDVENDSLKGEFYDPRTGVKISSIVAGPEKIHFYAEINPANSVCHRSPLKSLVAGTFIKLATSSGGGLSPLKGAPGGGSNPNSFSGDVITLLPGDEFESGMNFKSNEPEICDYRRVKAKLEKLEPLSSWVLSGNPFSLKQTVALNGSQINFSRFKIPENAPLNSKINIVMKTFQESENEAEAVTRNITLLVGKKRGAEFLAVSNVPRESK